MGELAARGSARRSRVLLVFGSGCCRFEGDFIAEGFEVPDVGVLAAFRADPAVVVAGTEVGVGGVRVR
jgi:hypothetical protein